MRVLQICTGFDISFHGGITNYVRNISSTMADNGHDVTVLYSKDNKEEKNYSFKTLDINPKLRPFHLSSIISNSDIDLLEKIVKDISPDIIHVHMMIDLPVKALEVFKKYAKVVISLHDYSYVCNRIILLDKEGKLCTNSETNKKCNSCISFEETIDNRYVSAGVREGLKLLKIKKIGNSSGHHERFLVGQKLFKNVDSLIAVSNRVKEIYQENGYDNDLFIVNHIGNYTADETFRSNFTGRVKKDPSQKLKLGFIGNLNYHKGANLFLKLVENSDHEFHIYGGIENSVLEKIQSKPHVFYHGRYQHNDLVDILKQIDLGLVLSIWEDNAPQVVFEFLNAGVPVIGTKMGGIPDFVNENNGFLFEIDEVGIESVLQLMNSDEIYNLYNRVINTINGTKTASQHMDELMKIYNQIL
jgi:glycosyltransferase involved in cell wall biosynthesis